MMPYVGRIDNNQRDILKEESEPSKKIMVFQLYMNLVVNLQSE